MKIVINIQSINLVREFYRISNHKSNNVEIINTESEKMLFNSINIGDVNAFIIDSEFSYTQRAVNFIKKKHPYIAVIVIGKKFNEIDNADIYIDYIKDSMTLYELLIKNILNYERNFKKLKTLTANKEKKVHFMECSYDPNNRLLTYKGKNIINLSEKAGGIIEFLGSNYGNLVKRELILEKVWSKNDYYSSRSMDVYLTNLRRIFKENNIKLTIKNISKRGIIME